MSIAEPPVSERTAVCDSGVTVSATLAGRLLLGLQVVALLLMAGTVATKVWQDHIWAGFALVGITLVVWAPEVRFRRERVWWFAYVAGIFVYTLLRAYADETGIPVRTQYVISIDQAVFLGTDPIVWLQQRFFDPVSLGLHDYLSVVVHWSFFIAPHLGAVLVFLYRRTLFPKYVVMIAGTMYLALVLFFLLPTAPPWLAGQTGALPGAYRVMDFVGGSVDPDTYQSFYASLGEPNSVAAMPSLHQGVTFAMYLWARDHAPRLAPWLLVYSLVMGAALMYLGEHYLADLAVGMGCAAVLWLAARRWLSPAPIETR
ncbi:MAG: phosphatase PAP2 family protein [Dehalococcoidia bacterium]|nr:phosphatase PAP2 family protein [Dehalococcoidia bacterium]